MEYHEMKSESAGKKKFGFGRACMLVLIVFLLIMSIGSILGLSERTLIKWWIPAIAALIPAFLCAAFSERLWHRFTGIDSRIINMIASALFTYIFCVGLFYSLNYIFASPEGRQEDIGIERKYTKTRHRSKRVGRNRYVRGEPYKVWFAEISFSDGRKKNIEIPYNVYRKIRKGGKASIDVARGLFGADVIKGNPKMTYIPHIEESEEDRGPYRRYGRRKGPRCRFFGTSGRRDSIDTQK